MRSISQMSMGNGGYSAGQSPRKNQPDLKQYGKPALFAAAGILALALLVIAVRALAGGKDRQTDYEKAALAFANLPVSEKELEKWQGRLQDCYPPEAEKVLEEWNALGEEVVDMMGKMREEITEYMDLSEEEAEEFMGLLEEALSSLSVSESRMLDREECRECEELIERFHDISIPVDGGCLVEMEVDPGVVEKILAKLEETYGEDVADGLPVTDGAGEVLLVLRSGKHIGVWGSGELELDEVTDLRKDLEWDIF